MKKKKLKDKDLHTRLMVSLIFFIENLTGGRRKQGWESAQREENNGAGVTVVE